MEPHPVPKNVLTVEFKLFGSLTVRQFMKILFGAVGAVVLFVLGLHPLIAIPLMAASVGTGIASALVPGFETRISALFRSMFVSPRYVWRKGDNTPDILEEDKVVTTTPVTQQKKYKNSLKDDTEVSLDRLLDARIQTQDSGTQDDLEQGLNFNRVYDQMYGGGNSRQTANSPQIMRPTSLAGPATVGASVPIGGGAMTTVRQIAPAVPRPLQAPIAPVPNPVQMIDTNQISQLQQQLAQMNKQGASPAEKQMIIDRINQIYANSGNQAVRPRELAVGKPVVFGVVVNKSDQPIGSAHVEFSSISGEHLPGAAVTTPDGRFKFESDLHPGQYAVTITHPQHKFVQYKVSIEPGKTPAYKFRSSD